MQQTRGGRSPLVMSSRNSRIRRSPKSQKPLRNQFGCKYAYLSPNYTGYNPELKYEDAQGRPHRQYGTIDINGTPVFYYPSFVTLVRVNSVTRSKQRFCLFLGKRQNLLGNKAWNVYSILLSRLEFNFYFPRVMEERYSISHAYEVRYGSSLSIIKISNETSFNWISAENPWSPWKRRYLN